MKKINVFLMITSLLFLCACSPVVNDTPTTTDANEFGTTESVNSDDKWELPIDVDDSGSGDHKDDSNSGNSGTEDVASQMTTEDVIDVVIDTTVPESGNDSPQTTTAPGQSGTTDGNKKPTEPNGKPSQSEETTTAGKPQATTKPEEKPVVTAPPKQDSGGIELPFIPG